MPIDMFLVPRRRLRILRYALFAVTVLPLLDYFWTYQSSYPSLHLTSDARNLKTTRSVYIASSLWNAGPLLQDHWIPSLLQVADDLKAADISVFIAIYENGSWDTTKSILERLRQTLDSRGIRHEIVIDDTSHEQIIRNNSSVAGWLETAYGRELRRIPYLASVRNEALKPLAALTTSGVKFDKLIFLNDVVFQVSLS